MANTAEELTAFDEHTQEWIPVELLAIRNFKGKYPKQLWLLFLSEMWERFAFYGMRGMLIIFMVEQLKLNDAAANLRYGAIQALVYTMAFVGGLFADKILGYRKSIFWGAFLMIIGSFVLAASPKELFYIGNSFIVIGTGFFKPNISTMVGDLYHKGDARRDAGFGLFYSGINIGGLLGGLLPIYAARMFNWNVAFALSGIGMIIGTAIFVYTRNKIGPIGLSPLENTHTKKQIFTKDIMVYIGSLLALPFILLLVSNSTYTDYFMYVIGPVTFLYITVEAFRYKGAARQKLFAAMIFILFSVLFWAFFEQSGGSLSLFALYNFKDNFVGIHIDRNAVNNFSNSLFVILLSPVVGLLWPWLNSKKAEPNTVVKFGLGFLFLALGFYVFRSTKLFAGPDGIIPSVDFFVIAWFAMTIGELCLSPIGLSIMTTLCPKPLHGVMMGMWFLASAYGQYIAGLLGAGMTTVSEHATPLEKLGAYTSGYQQLSVIALGAGILLIILSPAIRKLMHEVH